MPVINPKISVIMPVYNNEAYLPEAIESILSQTYADFEFIIISEFGTSPESVRIIESYSDNRIRHVPNETYLGMIESLNLGLKLARGKYVARMDADDISKPERFRRQIAYLEQHPDTGILGTGSEAVREDMTLIVIEERVTEAIMSKWLLLFGSPVAHPSVMARRDVLEQLGGYDPSVICEDYDLWIRASKITEIKNLPENLVTRRIHGMSSTLLRQEKVANASLALAQSSIQSLLSQELTIDDVRRLRLQGGSI